MLFQTWFDRTKVFIFFMNITLIYENWVGSVAHAEHVHGRYFTICAFGKFCLGLFSRNNPISSSPTPSTSPPAPCLSQSSLKAGSWGLGSRILFGKIPDFSGQEFKMFWEFQLIFKNHQYVFAIIA